jgi:hypothetical protein
MWQNIIRGVIDGLSFEVNFNNNRHRHHCSGDSLSQRVYRHTYRFLRNGWDFGGSRLSEGCLFDFDTEKETGEFDPAHNFVNPQ